MPTRDEGDFERRRQQIIDGALEVFASKGFERATNKDIAAAAGIGSPGLIYHYFQDKADLFRRVVEQRGAPVLMELLNRSETMMSLPPREALTLFGRAFLTVMENRAAMAMMKLILGEATRRPVVAEMFNALGPRRGVAFLASYLEQQMQAGTLRQMDPGAAVRCFVGPMIAFMLLREVFPQPDTRTLETETMVAATVEIFLRGMEVDATSDGGARREGARG
jgi:TetR/AcrR family transcriptional regulator, mexJK operon transcriptional repressor